MYVFIYIYIYYIRLTSKVKQLKNLFHTYAREKNIRGYEGYEQGYAYPWVR